MMIYALCRKIDFVENLRVLGVKIWTEISIRVKFLTFSMSEDRFAIFAMFFNFLGPRGYFHFQFLIIIPFLMMR